MIKIFISATDGGFSTKYASDGILEDIVTAKVLDERSLFSADILNREGYAFQPLPSQGILYHKIILLNEVVGGGVRDGYVMFSLFVPINCAISGTDIKAALDSIVNDYRKAIDGYNIKLNIDLSFVAAKAKELNAKAKELNAKAKSSPWSKKPSSNNNTGKVALLPVDDNRVAEYFQYPWPLHKDFSGFSMVFLTQRLLNPARQTPDGIKGYKALPLNIIDVSNPEYSIEYNEKVAGADLSSLRKTIYKSELDNSKDDIRLGTYSRFGYRSQQVTIKAGTQSDDGSTIKVILPTLGQKTAKLTLIVVNKKGDSLTNATCTCTNGSGEMIPAQRDGRTFNFLGEQCGKDWTISVQCESYNDHTETINVNDGSEEARTIVLTSKPQWNVIAQDSTGEIIIKTVSSTDKDKAIDLAKQSLAKEGYGDYEVTEDGTYTVTVKGKKQETDISQTRPSQDIPSTATATSSTAPSNNSTPDQNDPLPATLTSDNSQENTPSDQAQSQPDSPKKTYILQLNTAKDKASFIFKNEKCIEQLRINGVEYNSKKYRLECSCTEKPKYAAKFVLRNDKYYEYFILKPQWQEENPCSVPSTNTVKRKLRKKYRVCIGIASALLLCAIVSLGVYLFGNKDKKAVEELASNTGNFTSRNAGALYGVRYCGNIVYDSMESFHSQWADLIKKNEELKKYATFTSLDRLYKLQTQYKKCDSIILNRGLELSSAEIFDSVAWPDLKNDTMYKHLSEKSEDSLQTLHENKLAEIAEEARLYKSCMASKNTDTCNSYLRQYATDPKKKKTEKDAQNGKTKPSSNNSSPSSKKLDTIETSEDLFKKLGNTNSVLGGAGRNYMFKKENGYTFKKGAEYDSTPLEQWAKAIIDAACNKELNDAYAKKNGYAGDIAAQKRYKAAYEAAKNYPPTKQLATLLDSLDPKQQ